MAQCGHTANALKDVRFLSDVLSGNEHGDGPANHLLNRVSKQPLRGLVPGPNDSVKVLADDRPLDECTIAASRRWVISACVRSTANATCPEMMRPR